MNPILALIARNHGSIPLTATMPTNLTTAVTSTYPSTSATATTTVPIDVQGGQSPYTYAASIVSGPGTLVNGTTANPEIQLSETTTDPETSYTTVIESVVTDGLGNHVTTNTCTITQTFTLIYAPLSLVVTTTNGSCVSKGGTCTATGNASVSVSGGSDSYTYSWTIVSGSGTLATPTASSTNITYSDFVSYTDLVTVKVTVSDPKVASANATGTLSLQGHSI